MIQSSSRDRITPGRVILYQEPEAPPWPAIYLTQEATPKAFLETRPNGYCNAVLKLATVTDTKNLRWAQSSQMVSFNPWVTDQATKQSTPGLQDAYSVAHDAERFEYDSNYWKAMLASTQDKEIISVDDDSDIDWDHDRDMAEAIRLSLLDNDSQNAQLQSSPLASHSTHSNAQYGSPLSVNNNFRMHPTYSGLSLPIPESSRELPYSFIHMPLPSSQHHTFEPSTPSSKRRSPSPSAALRDEMSLPPQKRKLSGQFQNSWRSDPFSPASHASNDSRSPTLELSGEDMQLSKSRRKKQQFPPRSRKTPSGISTGDTLRRQGPNASVCAILDDDTLDEELDESGHFVQVFVGPTMDPATDRNIDVHRGKYRFQLMKHSVWDRPYFRDALAGKNYFTPSGENTWELTHPRLDLVSPDDFRMVAEFLSDGDFGVRDPQTEDQVAESFAECIAAWKTAELLGMDDLLDFIVLKMRNARAWWDMFHVMVFACEIYESDVALDAHAEMKAMLSDAIAEDFDVYIEDDTLRGEFTTRLKQLPDLRRDVFSKAADQAERRLQWQADYAAVPPEDVDDDDDNMDLYI